MVTDFPINKNVTIVCRTHRSPGGFRHICEYQEDGRTIETRSVSYINRTWEQYNYETAIRGLLEKMNFSKLAISRIMEITKKQALGEVDRMFGSIGAMAQLGEVMGGSKKEKNDWKARMLKAGLGGQGLQMPEDWDQLSEDEKERRLNRIIEHLRGK